MSVRTDLKGARWSSAVRCVAKATHEALGTPRDEEASFFLDGYFVRGVSAAEAWIERQRHLTEAAGKHLTAEAIIPWGPPEYGWEGHADAIIHEDKLVIEAYHAKGGEFRREKALQAAGYARKLGPEWKAMLAVFDTSDIDEDGGFPVSYIPLELDSDLLVDVADIERRVVEAVRAGEVNPADRQDTPRAQECRNCPFREPCWEGWVEPVPVYAPELDDLVAKFARLKSNKAHAEAAITAIDDEIDEIKEELRPYISPGVPLVAGGVAVKRSLVKPKTTFRFSAYTGAGHLVTPTMREFIHEGKQGSDRWDVRKHS